MIVNQRHLFDLPDDIAYLNCAYMSPLMKTVQDEGRKGIEAKARPWELSPPDFFTRSEAARAAFARIIGAAADDIAIIPSVSYGISLAARNLPLKSGEHILCLEDQFPSNIYPWQRMAAERGARVKTLPKQKAATTEGLDWTPAILEAIDESTAIIALPHCHWTDGALIDLVKVGEKARRHGSALVLDITQSGGALPFDVTKIQPDFVVCATYKWLLGPYSLGFAYIAPKWQTGSPLEEGWIARAGSENFARLVDYQEAYQPGARRFDMGERSNFHLMPMALAALEKILEWGVETIQTNLSARTDAIAKRAAGLGLESAPLHLRAGHFLGLRFAGGVPEDLLPTLAQKNIFVSVRGDSMRVTPHLYNTDEDI
ncbi:MAG TPA: aminotransferase class V-fold PLP-dependent enzyme, partial [Rhizobiales bacterium]|nr:aminotransferase class V-fold PLP-dependent enzyme [Hyphomicrobiales bacterium]